MGDLSVVEEICLSGISLGAKSNGGSYFPCMLPDVVPMIRPKCKAPFLGTLHHENKRLHHTLCKL